MRILLVLKRSVKHHPLYCAAADWKCAYFRDSEHIEFSRIDNIRCSGAGEFVNAYNLPAKSTTFPRKLARDRRGARGREG